MTASQARVSRRMGSLVVALLIVAAACGQGGTSPTAETTQPAPVGTTAPEDSTTSPTTRAPATVPAIAATTTPSTTTTTTTTGSPPPAGGSGPAIVPATAMTVSASSELAPAGALTYGAANAVDGNLTTAWVDGVPGPGVGESLTFNFTEPLLVTRIDIANGYWKSGDLYQRNARLRTAEIHTETSTFDVEFPDSVPDDWTGPETFEADFGTTTFVTIRASSVYAGSAHEDLAISEVGFWAESVQPLSPAAAAVAIYPIGAGPVSCWPENDEPQLYIESQAGVDYRGALEICFFGFDVARMLDVEVEFPDGTVTSFRLDAEPVFWDLDDGFGAFWEVLPDHPTGRYRMTGSQGSTSVTEEFLVEPVDGLHVSVFPLLDPGPTGAATGGVDHLNRLFRLGGDLDDTFRISFAGFPPGETITVDLLVLTQWRYRRTWSLADELWSTVEYQRSFDVTVGDGGGVVHELAMAPDDPPGAYCIGLDERWVEQYRTPPRWEAGRAATPQLVCNSTIFEAGWYPPSG